MVGDENHGHAPAAAERKDSVHHLAPPLGVEHGGRLIKNDDLRLHGDDARDGHALLLSAGEQVRGVLAVLIHADKAQRGVHALADLLRFHAQVFRGEGHIVLHHVCHDLVVRVLEDHTDATAHIEDARLVGGVDPVHQHAPLVRDEDGVHVLGEGGLAGAVLPKHRHKAAPFDGQIDAVQALPLIPGVAEMYVFKLDDCVQWQNLVF